MVLLGPRAEPLNGWRGRLPAAAFSPLRRIAFRPHPRPPPTKMSPVARSGLCSSLPLGRSSASSLLTGNCCHSRGKRRETSFVGIGRCLTTLSPPRNRACDFYRTRLLGFTLWSWSLPPKHDLHTLTVYGYWSNPISTFSQPLVRVHLSTSEVKLPTPRQHLFRSGSALSSRL
jgi:hypothetical protein